MRPYGLTAFDGPSGTVYVDLDEIACVSEAHDGREVGHYGGGEVRRLYLRGSAQIIILENKRNREWLMDSRGCGGLGLHLPEQRT